MWKEGGLHTLSRNGWVTVFGCFDVNALNRGGKEVKVTPLWHLTVWSITEVGR